MKALIVCHPRNLTENLSGHWLHNLIKQLNEKYFSGNIIEYHTVDILDIWDKKLNDIHTTHFIADVWCDDFIKTHTGMYDLVFMPDAGGAWYTDVLSQIKFQANMVNILDRTMMLVANNGIFMLGKFYTQQKNYIKASYKKAELFHYDEYNIEYFIFPNTTFKKSTKLIGQIKTPEKENTEKNIEDKYTIQLISDLKNMGYNTEQISEMIQDSQMHLLFD